MGTGKLSGAAPCSAEEPVEAASKYYAIVVIGGACGTSAPKSQKYGNGEVIL